MLDEGIYLAPSAFEAGFVSAAHGDDEIEQTLAVGRKVRSALTAAGAPTRAGELGVTSAELAAAVRQGRKSP